MIDWGVAAKIALSIFGFAFLAFGNSYQAHPDAPVMAHLAAIAVAVGGYLVGLFQAKPSGDATTSVKKLMPVVLVSIIGLSGCSLSPSADFITALGKDPASVCVNIGTPYGTVKYARTAIVNGNVTCNGDGLSVKSDGAAAGVPIMVVPQISVGSPVVTPSR